MRICGSYLESFNVRIPLFDNDCDLNLSRLLKDFHENGKVEVKLRCFEVEFSPPRRSVPAYPLFEDASNTHCKYSQFGENLNFKLT